MVAIIAAALHRITEHAVRLIDLLGECFALRFVLYPSQIRMCLLHALAIRRLNLALSRVRGNAEQGVVIGLRSWRSY